MKKYEYVTIHTDKFFSAKVQDYQEIINEYAAKGYRYIGFMPINMTDYGKIRDMDLIFEQDI